jgi:pentatricopeptide repeat protein
VAALQACISSLGLKQGKLIHGHILEATLESNIVANALIDLYIKCGSLADAQRIFNFLSTRDVVSWSTLISGYAFYGHEHIAIDLFHQMQYEGILPNIVTWNAVIACYALHGKSHIVFQLFEQMSLEPDCVTFVSLLKTCRNSMLVREVHAYIIQMDIQKDIIVGNTLIDLYAKLGSLADAYKVILMLDDRNAESWSALIAGCMHSGNVYEANIFFHKVEAEGIELHNVAWNALILGYCENGQSHEAVDLYIQMKELGIKPDHVTFLSVLKACSILGQYTTINLIHSQICEWETDLDIMVTNTLIDVYAKMGAIHDARKIFDLQWNRSLVTWNAMISGYAQHGMGQEAFELFQRMQNSGIDPDKFTYASILKACSSTLALDQGKAVHNQVVQSGFQLDVYLWSSFIDMYLVCGRHEDAQRLLSEMCANDTVTWNAVIAGCAKYSDYNRALQFFSEMKSECKMDDATYIGLLSACGHQGCVEEGFSHFSTMQCHDIDPTIDHYNCLVDILLSVRGV